MYEMSSLLNLDLRKNRAEVNPYVTNVVNINASSKLNSIMRERSKNVTTTVRTLKDTDVIEKERPTIVTASFKDGEYMEENKDVEANYETVDVPLEQKLYYILREYVLLCREEGLLATETIVFTENRLKRLIALCCGTNSGHVIIDFEEGSCIPERTRIRQIYIEEQKRLNVFEITYPEQFSILKSLNVSTNRVK